MEDRGPYTVAQLVAHGTSPAEVRELLAQGRLTRVARQWLADPFTATEAIRAVQLGGRLGCVSACRHHGLWTPQDPDLHVAVSASATLPATPPAGIRFHRLAAPCPTAVLPLAEAVAQALRHHDAETGLIVLESAVNGGRMTEADARLLLAGLPTRKARAAQYFSPLAQSGSETRLRLFFQRHRIPVQPQAFIPGVGRVDLLVGRSWIVEADSEAHHAQPQDVMVDRSRDLNSRVEGFDRDRLSFEQIWHSWDLTQEFLLTRARTRRHLRPPAPLRRHP